MLKPRGFQWRGVLSRSGFQDDSFRFSAVPVRTAVSAGGDFSLQHLPCLCQKASCSESWLAEGGLCHKVGRQSHSSTAKKDISAAQLRQRGARSLPLPPADLHRPGAFRSNGLFHLSGGSVEIRDVRAGSIGGRICLWAVVRLEALAAHRSGWKPLTSARGAVYAEEGVHIGGGRLEVTNASAAYAGGAALWKRSSRRRCLRGNLILLGHFSQLGAQRAHGTKSFATVKDSARLSRLQFGQGPSAKSLSSRDTVALIAWAKTPGLGSTSFLPQFMSRGARLRGTRAAKRPCRAQAAKFGFN